MLFADDRIRIPKDGNGEPRFDDHAYHPPVSTLTAVGVTGWNYVDGRSVFITIDLDGLNHVAGHDQQTLDDLVSRLLLIDQVEIIRSKSGRGYHVRLYFDPETTPRSRTRDDHIAVGNRALAWLASRIGQDLESKSDAVGVVAWIYHTERGPNGFAIVKRSTANMPADWESEFPQHVSTGECELPDHPTLPLTPKHKTIIDFLTQRGMGEWKDGRLVTHTYNLLVTSQEKSLGIVGNYATISPGEDCPADRNCFAYPAENGSWIVFRFGKNTPEHQSWWKSANGYTTTWFNRGKESKGDVPSMIVALAKNDELFHDSTGRAFVTTVLHGVKETLTVSDSRFKAKLRLAYTSQTGRIASGDHITTAGAQLEAVALLDRPEYPVSIRVAEHAGRLYIDLADRDRRIVEVSRDGWRLIEQAPVRFVRPFGTLPLPVPVQGGSIDDLRRFVNVDDADLPLLLAFVAGCFHPSGPYPLLQIIGEQGSAKSWLMRFIHDFCGPANSSRQRITERRAGFACVGATAWLMSFDNADALSRKLSSWFCMLCTGAASANRKLFTDADQSLLRAKRPIIITAIANVVTAADLLDRTLTLLLPPIPAEQRKSEFAIAQELRVTVFAAESSASFLTALHRRLPAMQVFNATICHASRICFRGQLLPKPAWDYLPDRPSTLSNDKLTKNRSILPIHNLAVKS